MKILLDPQIFYQQTYGGISRYYTEVFSVLSKKKEVEIILPIYNSDNAYLKETNLPAKNKSLHILYKVLSFFKISTRSLRKRKSDQLLEVKFQANDYDVVVPTYYNPYFLEKINGKPYVLTVYDMIHELLPQYFVDDEFRVVERKALLLDKATKIIAVSHNTKKDIIKVYPHIDADKIVVVYHGTSIKIDNDIKVELPQNYVLYVGARPNYKNFKFLVKSIEPLLIKDSSLFLIAAGGGKFNEEELAYLKSLSIEKQVVQRRFEENELGHFYKNAKCFVLPSLYEGFGIPVVESMACGCPIILSTHGSLPEIAGDAGIYFNSESENDLKEKIENLINNPELRAEYAQKGLEHVKKYDWNEAAEQCLQVYKDAAKAN